MIDWKFFLFFQKGKLYYLETDKIILIIIEKYRSLSSMTFLKIKQKDINIKAFTLDLGHDAYDLSLMEAYN